MRPNSPVATAALVCDYGKFHSFGDSIRGIRKHKFVDILLQPGRIDLVRARTTAAAARMSNKPAHTLSPMHHKQSADVDFTALGQAASVTGKAKVRHTCTQSSLFRFHS